MTTKNRLPNESLARKLGVHPDVLKLGLVSLLTDVSSEMIFAVFAVFFTTIAGASAALLGVIETGVPTANVAWGEDGSTLFIAADTSIYRLRTRTRGSGWTR